MAPISELRRLIQRTISIFRYLQTEVCHILYLLENFNSKINFKTAVLKRKSSCRISRGLAEIEICYFTLCSKGERNISTDPGPVPYRDSRKFFYAEDCVEKNRVLAGVMKVSCNSFRLLLCVCVWMLHTYHILAPTSALWCSCGDTWFEISLNI